MRKCLLLLASWKEFAYAGEGIGQGAAGYDKGYGEDNQQQAHAVAQRELLMEDGNAEENRRGGLQRAEDSHGCRTDIADCLRGAEQRDSCRQQPERQQIPP